MLDLLPAQQQNLASNIFLSQDKIDNGNLYYCQPHTVIQLVEVAPPPPRNLSSVIYSSSAASSSYASTSSSSYDEDDEMDEDEDEDESVCSSYCSSDLPPDGEESSSKPAVTYWPQSDSLAGLKKRILLWREHSEVPQLDSASLKRKLEEMDELEEDVSDNVSHTSKRSRSHGSSASSRSISSEELNMHPCPACDAFFPTLQSLRQHGSRDAPESNEACCVAVEYAFEQ
ncbi:hypothetical protein CVT26_001584 [Gymnopilus dilepis]|uniref:Uncharacterized protein n=1 Tax=Gymnopilus dilepis TaxID=231916 RepID=A0A409VTR9_9AGAR|nr:hypothetical protein CVT26_001584 [Gymnopilus dilepis]